MRDARLAAVAWRDLVALDRCEVARELVLPFAVLAVALLAGAARCWPLLALASGVMFMAGLRVTHGAFHRSLGLNGRANDVVMFVLSALLGGSMHAIEVTHLRHHRDCLADDDIEGRIVALGFWRALVDSPRYPFAIHRAAWRHGSLRQRRWIAVELVATAIVQALVWSRGGAMLQGIVSSLYVANALAAMPGIWFVHHGCRHGDGAIARTTRTRWLARLTIGMFHHAEHHAFPAVPTCRLAVLARRIDAVGATPPSIGRFSTARVDDPVDKFWMEARKRRCHAAVKKGCANLAHSIRVASERLDPAPRSRAYPSRWRRTTMSFRLFCCFAMASACASSALAGQKVTAPADMPHRPAVDTPRATERKGMTWGVGSRVSPDESIVFVSCHGRPAIDGHGCDAYVGDTACSAKRPLLCLDIDGRPRPEHVATPRAGGAMEDGFYSGWVEGRIALAPAVRGDAFARRSDADAYCAATFGRDWRVAEHHDGVTSDGSHGGWGFVANGRIDDASRFWVAIDDTSANCWDASR